MSNIYAEITDGVVTNALNFPTGQTGPVGWISAPNEFNIGWTYDGTTFVAPTVPVDELRVERDKLLHESDFTQLGDSPHEATAKTAWATYRQELRDLPDGYTPVASPTYPTKP